MGTTVVGLKAHGPRINCDAGNWSITPFSAVLVIIPEVKIVLSFKLKELRIVRLDSQPVKSMELMNVRKVLFILNE